MRLLVFILCTVLSSLAAENSKAWGSQLILDCKGCNIDKISCSCNLSAFVKVLVDDLGMIRYGEPLVEFFEPNDDDAGYSLVVLAENGSVTGHFVEKTGAAFIDVIWNKPFDAQLALKDVRDFLEPQDINTRTITRQSP